MTKEIWKDIPGYEGLYKISNLGNVLSLNYHREHINKILKTHHTHDGYVSVRLCKNSVKHNTTVHILVAKAFIPNPENKPQVNHIDGNKDNNTVSNLEWVTGKENISHAITNGLRPKMAYTPSKGSENSSSKPIAQYDLKGNLVKVWDCQSDAARFYKCKTSTIVNCAKQRIMSCKGYIWRYPSDPIQNTIKIPYNKFAPHKILQKSLDGEVINEWNSYSQITSATGYNSACINECCHGKQKTAYGFKWECVFL